MFAVIITVYSQSMQSLTLRNIHHPSFIYSHNQDFIVQCWCTLDVRLYHVLCKLVSVYQWYAYLQCYLCNEALHHNGVRMLLLLQMNDFFQEVFYTIHNIHSTSAHDKSNKVLGQNVPPKPNFSGYTLGRHSLYKALPV